MTTVTVAEQFEFTSHEGSKFKYSLVFLGKIKLHRLFPVLGDARNDSRALHGGATNFPGTFSSNSPLKLSLSSLFLFFLSSSLLSLLLFRRFLLFSGFGPVASTRGCPRVREIPVACQPWRVIHRCNLFFLPLV